MATIVIKIKIDNVEKPYQTAMKNSDTIKDTIDRVKANNTLDASISDFGLYRHTGDKTGKYLDNNTTLVTAGVKDGDTLLFKKRFRTFKFYLADQTVKTALIDESMTVSDLVKDLARKFDLKNPEVMSFRVNTEKLGKRAWLKSHLSLPEQGITPDSVIQLKTKLYSKEGDKIMDFKDPAAVHFCFTELRDAIIAGEHPLSKEEAVQFGALICQIQYGNHNKELEKKGTIVLADVLPPAHASSKSIDKDLYKVHASLVNLSKQQAQERFIRSVWALKTYGVTFFNGTDDQAAKGKKVNSFLIGISEKSVTKFDSENHTVIKSYPMEHLKKWSSNGSMFTFDFGDYGEGFVSVYTDDCDAIDILLSGYRELDQKKKQQVKIENLTSSSVDESSKQAILPDGPTPVLGANVQLMIKQAMSAASGAIEDVEATAALPPISSNSERVSARIDNVRLARLQMRTCVQALCPAIAQLINQLMVITSVGQLDSKMVIEVFRQLSEQTPAVATAVKNAYTNADPSVIDEQATASLAKTGATLAETVSNFINDANAAMHVLAVGALSTGLKDNVLDSASAFGDTATQFLTLACAQEVDDLKQGDLVDRTVEITSIAEKLSDDIKQHAQENNISAHDIRLAMDTLTSSARLVEAVARVLAPTMIHEGAYTQLQFSSKMLTSATTNVQTVTGRAGIKKSEFTSSLMSIAEKTSDMMIYIKEMTELWEKGWVVQLKLAVDPVTDATVQMGVGAANGDRSKVIQSTKIVAEATQNLITLTRAACGCEPDPFLHGALVLVTRSIADAMQKVVRSATAVAKNPGDVAAAGNLLGATTHLNCETGRLVSDMNRKMTYKSLIAGSKAASDALSQLVLAGKAAAPSNTNQQSQVAITSASIDCQASIASLVESLRAMESRPHDTSNQMSLLGSSKSIVGPATKLLQAVHPAAPNISDRAAQVNLAAAAKNAGNALQALSVAIKNASDASGSLEIEASIGSVDSIVEEVDDHIRNTSSAAMEVQTAFDPYQVAQDFTSSIRVLATTAAAMIALLQQTDKKQMGVMSKKIVAALIGVVRDTRAVCCTTGHQKYQMNLLNELKRVSVAIRGLMHVCRQIEATPNDPRNEQNMKNSDHEITESLNALVSELPIVRVCDDAITKIKDISKGVSMATLPTVNQPKPYNQYITDVNGFSKDLANNIANCVSRARGVPDALIESIQAVCTNWPSLSERAAESAAVCGDVSAQQNILEAYSTLSVSIVTILGTIKTVALDPKNVDLQKKLSLNAKSSSQHINGVMKAVKLASPAIRDVEDGFARLEQINQNNLPDVPNGASYYVIAEGVFKNSAVLNSLSNSVMMATEAANEDVEQLGQASKAYSNACVSLASSATLAALLAGGVLPGPRKCKYAYHDTEFAAAIEAVKAASDPKKVVQAIQGIREVASRIAGDINSTISLESDAAATLKANAQAFSESLGALAQATKGYVAKSKDEAAKKIFDDSVINVQKAEQKLVASAKTSINEPVQPAALLECQNNIINGVMAVVGAAKSVVELCRTAAEKPKEKASIKNKLIVFNKSVADSLARLLVVLENSTPGCQELAAAITKAETAMADVDAAVINVTIGSLEADSKLTYGQAQALMISANKEVLNILQTLPGVIMNKPNVLPETATQLAVQLGSVSRGSVAAAGTTKDKTLQLQGLTLAKGVLEPCIAVVRLARCAVVESKNEAKTGAVSSKLSECTEALKALGAALRVGVSATRECETAMEDINNARKNIHAANKTSGDTFQIASKNLSERATNLSQAISSLNNLAKGSPDALGSACATVAAAVEQLVKVTCIVIGLTNKPEIGVAADNLVGAALDVVTKCKLVTERPEKTAIDAVSASAIASADKVAALFAALKSAATGARECEVSCQQIRATASDLETSIVLADQEEGVFMEHVSSINGQLAALKNSLSEIIKCTTQDAVGKVSTTQANDYTTLATVSRPALIALTDKSSRTKLLGFIKNVGDLLVVTINASLNASNDNGAAMQTAKKETSDQLDQLTEFMSVVADSTIIGIKACEKTIDEVRKLIATAPKAAANVEPAECVNCAKEIAVVLGKIVSATKAGQKQLQQSLPELPPALKKLLEASVGCLYVTDIEADRKAVVDSVAEVSNKVVAALSSIVDCGARVALQDSQLKLRNDVKMVTESIRRVISAVESLRNIDDLAAQQAAKELEAAAAKIAATAEKLSKLKPKKPANAKEEDMNFEEVIYLACESLARATGALVTSALSAQSEMSKDASTSEEVVAASKAVSDATARLAEYSMGKEVALMASAKEITASTTRLVRSVAGADTDSLHAKKLNGALTAVTNAVNSLVHSAKAYMDEIKAQKEAEEEEKRLKLAQAAMSEAERGQMEQQIQMLKLERELAKAKMKQQQYSGQK